MSPPSPYVGRFAPSPTGPLHEGSVATALASWLDARAHRGSWLLRIEDIDPPREQAGSQALILNTLQCLGLRWDGQPSLQSGHTARFEQALDRLVGAGRAYPCTCTRREIADSQAALERPSTRHQALPYPGTCRDGMPAGRTARAWRLRVPDGPVHFHDRRLGPQCQSVATEVGDFVLKRADGLWAYQLAVVVDDAAQGVTDVVRGADLLDSTARQIVLGQALSLPPLRYLHVPVVPGADGEKLSKQNGATAVDYRRPIDTLSRALGHLGLLAPTADSLESWLSQATARWAEAWRIKSS